MSLSPFKALGRVPQLAAAFVAVVLLSACGGGSGGTVGTTTPPGNPVTNPGGGEPPVVTNPPAEGVSPGTHPPKTLGQPPVASTVATSRTEAARFLAQATFGANQASIDELMNVFGGNYAAWIDSQLEKASPSPSYYQYVSQATGPGSVFGLFWRHATYDDAQLRQRMAFALSQIFVTSAEMRFFPEAYRTNAAASYYGMLTDQAFSPYRETLERVTLHPYMGLYLGTLRNQKESADGKTIPDQNYAREVMQLFSIGLLELNTDGTAKSGPDGLAIPTYNSQDIVGLSRVLTGWGWNNGSSFFQDCGLRQQDVCNNMPMRAFPSFHSKLEKRFLGSAIPPNTDIQTSLTLALDRIASHPNVAPFIARRLIQQFVTSNPTRDYVNRVAHVFNTTNGNLGQVVKAVLLDAEARDTDYARRTPGFGKVREPVIRLTNWMRAFELVRLNGASLEKNPLHFEMASKRGELCQYPMSSPSVFNFWRPGYVPNAAFAESAEGLGLVAPEMQVVQEVCVATYLQMMKAVVGGIKDNGSSNLVFGLTNGSGDVLMKSSYSRELGMDPVTLVATLNEELVAGRMPQDLRDKLVTAMNSVPNPQPPNPANQLRRVQIAVFLTMASPEYLIQK
jgi:uncharacterized protein (DUF1800 family)